MGGLKEEIRSVIALHQPRTVDTASALALLQEEELASNRVRPVRKTTKFQSMDRKNGDADKPKPVVSTSESEDKWLTLKQQRRKQGLCFKCGNKWSHNHKCPDQVSLHVLEEVLDAIEMETNDTIPDTEIQDETILALKDENTVNPVRRKTFRLLATIGKQQVFVLVDLGSVGTFVSEHLVQQLKMPVTDCPPAHYKAADGGTLSCTKMVADLQWYVQGTTFSSKAQVLPLKCFDMIVGEDWLEEVSPI